MKYRLEIRPPAATDIAESLRWYEQQRHGLGQEFLEALGNALDTIQEYPERFAPIYRDVRRVLLKRFPYAVMYVIRDDMIIVVAVFHGSRDPRKWMRHERP